MLAIFENREELGCARGNCWPVVGGQWATNWLETGGGGSGHKRAAGIMGFQRPRYGPRLTLVSCVFATCRRRGSNPHGLAATRF